MQVLELAGNAARDNNKTRIVPRHIQLAVRNYEELSKLLRDVTITNGEVMPNIHNLLLPKKTGGRRICQFLSNVPVKKRDSGTRTFASSSDKSSGIKSTSMPSMSQAESTNIHMEASHPNSVLSETAHSVVHLSDARENGVVLLEDKFFGQETPLAEMSKLNDEIHRKNEQIASLGRQIADSIVPSHDKKDNFEESQVKAADNRIIQEQLNQKANEIEDLKKKVTILTVSKEELELRNNKLAYESSYAKGLASCCCRVKGCV
ncbi:Kinesin-like protein [Forsythia ovata]|uniref:Histone H2A n=1 Tax=Forsythia ovata TaxID=205694 RepID=A0ABD1PJN5_9LAMI